MEEVRITVIEFDGRLQEREIPSFRGAVMGIAGNDPLFLPGATHAMRIGPGYRKFVVRDVLEEVFTPSLKAGKILRYELRWTATRHSPIRMVAASCLE